CRRPSPNSSTTFAPDSRRRVRPRPPNSAMLRITELRLPLDHPEDELRTAVVTRLGIAPEDLLSFIIFRRGWDARKKSAIKLVYTIDAEVRDEPAVRARLEGDRHVNPAPDT